MRVTNIPQAMWFPQLVPLREFIVSPGVAAAGFVVAGPIVVCALLYGFRRAGKWWAQAHEQRERHHEQARKDAQHAAAVTQCRQQFMELVHRGH
jgi:hypothetical protein